MLLHKNLRNLYYAHPAGQNKYRMNLNELTETQILEQIRKTFEHETMEGIDTDELIESSRTLEELIQKIRQALQLRNAKSLS